MGKKIYAVKIGRNPGIYTEWSECQKNVSGFSGAIYKSFTNMEEAKKFMNCESDKCDCSTKQIVSNSQAVAYVDGSYNNQKREYSYGMVILYDGIEEQFAEKFNDKKMVSMGNVAGEIEGAKRAMKFCVDNGIKSIDIVYDYAGIEKWCTGEWKTNKKGTKEYKQFYDRMSKTISINFIKVKGHSGNKYNDLADNLAKSALGLSSNSQVISEYLNGIVAENIEYNDLISIFELVKEDFASLILEEEEIPYGKKFVLAIDEPSKQKVVVNHYNSKNKLSIQGKKEDLFNKLLLYIVELIDVEQIPDFLNIVHELDIDSDVVESEFLSYFPNSYDKIPHELNNYLHQAVYNLNIRGNMYVYNFLVEPVIRPLEAILKIALQDNDIPIRCENDNYDSFFVFRKDKDRYVLQDDYKKDYHTVEILEYLSECYTYFNKNRHTLLHWDNPKSKVDTTRILNSVEEAHTIIKDSIKLIDKYYKISSK